MLPLVPTKDHVSPKDDGLLLEQVVAAVVEVLSERSVYRYVFP